MPIKQYGRVATSAILLASWTLLMNGQTQTIREQLAEKGHDSSRVRGVPSGAAPRVSELLRDVDRIARGFVGDSRAYLSDDQREVYTDYTIDKATILYDRQAQQEIVARVIEIHR